MNFHHVSVMPKEIINFLVTDAAGTYVDCTLGGGGHALGIAQKLDKAGRLIGIDQDDAAIAAAKGRLKNVTCRTEFVRANFSELTSILAEHQINKVSGILFDLGVSSPQIDTPERGFSYMQDARLDMRMDRRQKISAYEIVNEFSEKELTEIFFAYGEERFSKRVASLIAKKRAEAPIVGTQELVSIIENAIPAKIKAKTHGHVAKRVFQALRLAVNRELEVLSPALRAAVAALKPQGRLAVLTFHSLEDREVKRTFKTLATGCLCPPQIPVCVCGHQAEIKLCGKPLLPTAEEVAANPRAKSAKLRLIEKL